ncbi:RNA recognition motif domain [Trypanosoma melophagium]|uniref:RNA recognition motif domain n=1 Tax=Trypanosoma melophagium TaxID=715481 RepID=UPI00351A8B3B|nr:RNA recognition motif domain [Trypanosoma melophagium]
MQPSFIMFDAWVSPDRPVSPVSSASSAEVTAGHDISTINRTLDVSSIHDDACLMDVGVRYWIRVTHLDASTTSKTLKYMFYPYGGDEAFLIWENGVVGYVGFENKCMTDLAVEKMDAFIPCRQTQPLSVTPVTLEEVLIAKNTAPFSNQKSLIQLLYSDCPVNIITNVIEYHKQPSSCAIELVDEIHRGPASILSRVLGAFSGLKQSWISMEEFREAVVRHLLRHIVGYDSRDTSTNCGLMIGELFLMGFLTGDPFHLASRIFERGVHCSSQIDNICAIAQTCASMPFPISKASFWAMMGQASLQLDDPLRTTIRNHLRQFQHTTGVFSPLQTVTPNKSWNAHSVNSSSYTLPESKSKTVYISHLPPLLSQQMFMELLTMCGKVNKVRICRGNGYCTLFAFVEMSTAEEAKATLRLSRMNILGCSIRVQIARNPIQDAQGDDAVIDASGITTRSCLFGQCVGTLATAAEIGGKSTSK